MIEKILGWFTTAARVINVVKAAIPNAGQSLGNVLVHDLMSDSASLHNYETGQAVIGGALTVPGESARAIFVIVKEHGPAYQGLFGEEPATIKPMDLHGGIASDGTDPTDPAPTGP